MRFGLAENIIEKIIEVLETNPKVDKAYIFGSRAKGNFREASDIDIAIKGAGLNYDDVLQLSVKLEELEIPYKIDLLDFYAIKEALLKEHIERVGIEFYSSWKEYKLGDIAEITSSKRIFYSDYVTSGIPFYRSKEIIEKSNGKKINTELFITNEKYFEIKKRFGAPQDNDVLISAVGERAGIPYQVKNDGDFYFKDGNLIWFRKFNKDISSAFLVQYFKSYIGQHSLESTMIGSAQKALTIVGLKGITVKFPPLPEQTAIASILSSLDDKIDLLHRQNKTLEQLAETLFRQWFVEEADESWEVGKLGDVIDLIYGKALKEETRSEGIYPVVGSNGIVDYHSEFLVEAPGIVIGRKGTLGKVNYLFDNFFPIDTTYFVKSKVNSAGLLYEYFLLKTLNFEELNSDSAVPGLNRDIALSSQIKIAQIERIEKFNEQCSPVFKKTKVNKIQIQTLTKLRDTLLPKLMSGEVRVKI